MKRIRGNTHVVYNLVSHLLLSLRLQKKKASQTIRMSIATKETFDRELALLIYNCV